jgi:hypothetical protein
VANVQKTDIYVKRFALESWNSQEEQLLKSAKVLTGVYAGIVTFIPLTQFEKWVHEGDGATMKATHFFEEHVPFHAKAVKGVIEKIESLEIEDDS